MEASRLPGLKTGAVWQGQLEGAREAVAAELEALRAGLARRQAVAQARALLELMQATVHAMSKARPLLGNLIRVLA